MTPDEFFDQYTDTQWFDFKGDRPKLVRACVTLCERVPDDVWDEMPHVLIFAPSPRELGSCTYIPRNPRLMRESDAFLYFAPKLERSKQAEVDFTVAHEFAHALCQHHRNLSLTEKEVEEGYLKFNAEQEADKLAVKWGYTIPEYRKAGSK